MYAYRIKKILTEDGMITLDKLPFQIGDEVEIIILADPHPLPEDDPYPLRGKPVQYDQPTEPVAETDWGYKKNRMRRIDGLGGGSRTDVHE